MKTPFTESSNSQSISALTGNDSIDPKPPSFEIVTVIAHAGQTIDNFTFLEFVYATAALIDMPTFPLGGIVDFVHSVDG